MQAIDDSLKRLQMDYVDVYYIHHVDTQDTVGGDAPGIGRFGASGQGALYGV